MVAEEMLALPDTSPADRAWARELVVSVELAWTVRLTAPAFDPFDTDPSKCDFVEPPVVVLARLAPNPPTPPAIPPTLARAPWSDFELTRMSPVTLTTELLPTELSTSGVTLT